MLEEERFSLKAYLSKVLMASILPMMTFGGACIGYLIAAIYIYVKKEVFKMRTLMYVGFLGELLQQTLKFIVLPLIIASLISDIGVFETFFSKRILVQFIILGLLNKMVSVCLGIALAELIRPGFTGERGGGNWMTENTDIDSILDVVRQLIPYNIVEMNLRTTATFCIRPDNMTSNDMYQWDCSPDMAYSKHANLLGVMSCAIILGLSLVVLKSEGKPLYEFFLCVFHVIMVLLYWILWLMPFLIISLAAIQCMKWRQPSEIFIKLGICVSVMMLGFFIQCGILYPLMYFIGTGRNPFKYMTYFIKPILQAFATSSSAATVPVSKEALRKAGINRRLIDELLPIAHNISKDGGALFIGVAVVFISQLNAQRLSPGFYLSVALTAAMISSVSLGIPFGTTICLNMILESIGLPSRDIGMFLAMDFLIDRMSTIVNVLGDEILLAILEKENVKLLEEMDKDETV